MEAVAKWDTVEAVAKWDTVEAVATWETVEAVATWETVEAVEVVVVTATPATIARAGSAGGCRTVVST